MVDHNIPFQCEEDTFSDIFKNVNPGSVSYANGRIAPGATITLDDQRIENVLGSHDCRSILDKRTTNICRSDYIVEVVGSYDPRYMNWPVKLSGS